MRAVAGQAPQRWFVVEPGERIGWLSADSLGLQGAVAQSVEHLLCKKNTQSAVLNPHPRRNPAGETEPVRCSCFLGLEATEAFDEGDEIGSKMFGLLPMWRMPGTWIYDKTGVRKGTGQRVLISARQDGILVAPHK